MWREEENICSKEVGAVKNKDLEAVTEEHLEAVTEEHVQAKPRCIVRHPGVGDA